MITKLTNIIISVSMVWNEIFMRYEKLIRMGVPEIVITEEGRCLAEEMVLYYFGKEEPVIWD